jgi:anti-anti-sigma factor
VTRGQNIGTIGCEILMNFGATNYEIEPGITVVEISGQLDLSNNLMAIESLIEELIKEGARKLVVDLTGLTYVDSAGIGMLFGVSRQMDGAGGRMRIAGAQGSVAKVLSAVHMPRIVQMDPDVASACRAFAAAEAAG